MYSLGGGGADKIIIEIYFEMQHAKFKYFGKDKNEINAVVS